MIVRKILAGTLLIFCIAVFFENSFAVTLLTEEKALKKMFPEVDEITGETIVLTSTDIAKIKERLGGKLSHYQKRSKAKKGEVKKVEEKKAEEITEYTFYFGIKDDEKIGVAVIEQQPGKWGPVVFIVVLDTATAKVTNVAVMSYKEKRGRPIARRNFLKQFIGKGSEDRIKVRKDIRAISGATISSDCACFAVKKAIALYEELFLK